MMDESERRAALETRRARYRAIEEKRGRRLVAYATSTRAGLSANMAGDAVREFIDQIEADGFDGDAIDVLVHSHGGDALTAWKLMSVLRERFKKVGVLVPYMAFSAATLFAMGADEIVMHPYASLGPIDPQITARMGDKTRQFAYEDLGAFLHFLSKEVHLTEQQHFAAVVDRLFSTVDPLIVGAARRASELSTQVGARLLKLHSDDDRRCAQIAQNLNKSFFAHGDAVSRSRAEQLELAVAASDPALEKLMWKAYLELEQYFEIRTPWNPLIHVLANPEAAEQLRQAGPLNLPKDMPQEVAVQVYQQMAQQALARAAAGTVEVPYRLVYAVVESGSWASECISEGTASAAKLPDGRIQVTNTEKTTGWRALGGPDSTNLRPSATQPRGKRGRKDA